MLDDSSSGCACTAISVSGRSIGPAWHARVESPLASASSSRSCSAARLGSSTSTRSRRTDAPAGDDHVQLPAARAQPLGEREEHADARAVDVLRRRQIDHVDGGVLDESILEQTTDRLRVRHVDLARDRRDARLGVSVHHDVGEVSHDRSGSAIPASSTRRCRVEEVSISTVFISARIIMRPHPSWPAAAGCQVPASRIVTHTNPSSITPSTSTTPSAMPYAWSTAFVYASVAATITSKAWSRPTPFSRSQWAIDRRVDGHRLGEGRPGQEQARAGQRQRPHREERDVVGRALVEQGPDQVIARRFEVVRRLAGGALQQPEPFVDRFAAPLDQPVRVEQERRARLDPRRSTRVNAICDETPTGGARPSSRYRASCGPRINNGGG